MTSVAVANHSKRACVSMCLREHVQASKGACAYVLARPNVCVIQ